MDLQNKCSAIGENHAQKQVAVVHVVGDLLQSFGNAREPFAELIQKASSFAKTDWTSFTIEEAHVTLMQELRKHLLRFKDISSTVQPSCKDLFKLTPDGKMNVFKDVFKFDLESLQHVVQKACDGVRDVWSKAVTAQQQLLQDVSVEGWTTHFDTILEHAALCEALVCNPQYGALHTTSEIMLKNLKFVIKINKDFCYWVHAKLFFFVYTKIYIYIYIYTRIQGCRVALGNRGLQD